METARSAARNGPLSDHVVQSFWMNACDFYGGYPLVLSPEAIELVYLEQLAAFRADLVSAAESSTNGRQELICRKRRAVSNPVSRGMCMSSSNK